LSLFFLLFFHVFFTSPSAAVFAISSSTGVCITYKIDLLASFLLLRYPCSDKVPPRVTVIVPSPSPWSFPSLLLSELLDLSQNTRGHGRRGYLSRPRSSSSHISSPFSCRSPPDPLIRCTFLIFASSYASKATFPPRHKLFDCVVSPFFLFGPPHFFAGRSRPRWRGIWKTHGIFSSPRKEIGLP